MNEKVLNRRMVTGRLASAFATLVMIAAITLAVSPAARAQAGEWLRHIGPFSLIDRSVERYEAAAPESVPQPTAEPPTASVGQTVANAAAAEELSGFPVYEPRELPGSFVLVNGFTVMPQASGTVVVSFYRDADSHFLGINQYRFGPDDRWDQSYGQNETVRDLLVRGYDGVAINGRYMSNPYEDSQSDMPELLETNWIIWAENGIAYTLFSDSLSIDALLALAESMR